MLHRLSRSERRQLEMSRKETSEEPEKPIPKPRKKPPEQETAKTLPTPTPRKLVKGMSKAVERNDISDVTDESDEEYTTHVYLDGDACKSDIEEIEKEETESVINGDEEEKTGNNNQGLVQNEGGAEEDLS